MASPDTTVPDQADIHVPTDVPVESIRAGARMIVDQHTNVLTVAEVVAREIDDFGQHSLLIKVRGELRLAGSYRPGALIPVPTDEEIATYEEAQLRADVVRSINQLSHHVNNRVIPVSADNPLSIRCSIDDMAQLAAVAEALGVEVRTSYASGGPSRYAVVSWPVGGVSRGFYAEWTALNPDHSSYEAPAAE